MWSLNPALLKQVASECCQAYESVLVAQSCQAHSRHLMSVCGFSIVSKGMGRVRGGVRERVRVCGQPGSSSRRAYLYGCSCVNSGW